MRFVFCVFLVKLIKNIIILFGSGAGYALPGKLALYINRSLLSSSRIRFKKGVIFITGTNGKTTTTKIISHVLQNNGNKVLSNETGSNLLNGIVSKILDGFTLFLKFDYDYGVFEVDEFSLPQLLKDIEPDVIVFLNLSRDQLDRHGEVDIIFDKWFDSIVLLKTTKLLVLEKAHKPFNSFKNIFKSGYTTFFDSSPKYLEYIDLKGAFNASNVNAAFKVCQFFGISDELFTSSLSGFTHAYGRGEIIDKFQILLAKNPASFNNNLHIINTLSNTQDPSTVVLIVLNDNIPDGRDVSWIYDIDTQLLTENLGNATIYLAGSRAYDMAVRLSYADIPVLPTNIFSKLRNALVHLDQTESIQTVIVLPNYSAMLETRRILTGRSIL